MPFPLGQFHPISGEVRALQFDVPAGYEPVFGGLGFAEVFWADLHQEAQKTRNTIEESKAWAQTMIDRMKAFDCSGDPATRDGSNGSGSVDYAKTRAVVGEMIETIGVLENLCFIAGKVGLPKFKLRNLLDDYLGAVQLVAEFKDYGGRIFDRFSGMMRDLLTAHPDVKDIYIVAHSEGTVVTFYGLLAALSVPGGADQEWVKRVRGYMTIGSPIDKHIVMWPNLWKKFHEHLDKDGKAIPWTAKGVRREEAIVWWNYYDFGDPVGFKLDTARDWLMDHFWVKEDNTKQKREETRVAADRGEQRFFHFPEEQDIGFTRYPLPGVAHNEYWRDADVFGHFISEVMTPDCPKKQPIPKSLFWPRIVSWVCPYVLCYFLLCGGTYILYRNLHPLLQTDNSGKEAFMDVVGAVCGIAALLSGITVASRIPRLIPFGMWHLISLAVFAVGATLYLCVPDSVQHHLGACFWASSLADMNATDLDRRVVIGAAALIAIVSLVISAYKPKWGMKPLIVLASIATIRIAVVLLDGNKITVWPIALSMAAFIYIWWLAALIFDLVFVWHRYICSNETVTILKKIRHKRRIASGEVKARESGNQTSTTS